MLVDLTQTMFFKTSFDIETVPGGDALWELVREFRRWLRGKAERDGYSMPWEMQEWSAVKAGTTIQATGSDIKLISCLHIEDEVYTWACQLKETQDSSSGKASRQWVTEIGFLGETLEKGRVSIVLSYGDKPGFIGDLQEEPSPSIPRLVKLLVSDKSLTCTISGVETKTVPREISDAQAAYAIISDVKRETPVVFVSPTANGNLLVDVSALSDVLGPNAIILYTINITIADKLNTLLRSHELQCYGGALRVYAPNPHIDRPGEYLRHRYIPMKDIIDKGSDAILAMLRRALAQDVHFWQEMLRVEDIKRLNRASSHEKRIAELKTKYEDDALNDMLDAEEKVAQAEQVCDQVLEENSHLKKENFDLESRCQSYEQAFASVGTSSDSASCTLHEQMRAMSNFPSTPESVARLAVAVFSDCIDFSDRGKASLADCRTGTDTLWSALYDICIVLYPLYTSKRGADIVSEFRNNSRFELALSEGMQTHKDPRLMAQREDVYQGRKICIEPHVSSSTGDPSSPRFIRIYFAWDESSEKIIIGNCGKHLDNYSTRSLH